MTFSMRTDNYNLRYEDRLLQGRVGTLTRILHGDGTIVGPFGPFTADPAF